MSEYDPFAMSLIEGLDLDNVPDQAPVEAGEYELKILNCSVEESKNKPGAYNVVVVMQIIGHPNSLNVFRYLSLPVPDDSEDTRTAKRRFIKEFCQAFGIAQNELGTEACKGKTAFALLQVREYEGRESNDVKRFITPAA